MAREDLRWVVIEDFSPGVVSPNGYPYETSVDRAPGPKGSAIDAYGCIATPTGDLGPGPLLIEWITETPNFNEDDWDDADVRPQPYSKQYITASTILSPSWTVRDRTSSDVDFNTPDCLFIAYSVYHDDAGTPAGNYYHFEGYRMYRMGRGGSDAEWISYILNNKATSPTTGADLQHHSATLTKGYGYEIDNSSPPATPDDWRDFGDANGLVPYVIYGSRRVNDVSQLGLKKPSILCWPRPSEYVLGVNNDPDDDTRFWSGHAMTVHDGRLVVVNGSGDIEFTEERGMGAGFGAGSAVTIQHGNTHLVYSDIYKYGFDDSSTDYPGFIPLSANATLGPAIIQSLNDEALLVIMMSGGGYLLRGTIEDPQITYLPGLPTVGYANNIGAYTPHGFFFGTRDGMWLWNEGSTATYVSQSLPGWFWKGSDDDIDQGAYDPRASKGKFNYAHPYVLCPGNYIFDSRYGSFWRFATSRQPDGGDQYYSYEISASGRAYAIYRYIDRTSTGDNQMWDVWDFTRPENRLNAKWFWYGTDFEEISFTEARQVVAREIEITCSGYGTVDVTVDAGDSSVSDQLTVASNYPQTFRITLAASTKDATGAADAVAGVRMAFEATGDGNGPLPTVHRGVKLGYMVNQQSATV